MKGARKILWPVFVLATTGAFVVAFDAGFAEPSLAIVPLVVGVFLFALEFVTPEREGHGTWGDPQAWNDIGHSVIGQGAGNALGQAVFVVGAALLAGQVSARFGGNLWPADWPVWAQVVLCLVVADGLDYVRHRLEHQAPWLWPIHALHHDVDRMNVLKSSRGHALDMLFRNLVVYAPLALAGAPQAVLLAYAAAVTVFGPIAHANVTVPVPSWLYRIVLTPQVHRIHHARPMTLSSSNYANVFPWWDVLFGSFEHPDDHPSFEFGVETGHQPESFVGQTLEPIAVWRRAARSRKAMSAGSPDAQLGVGKAPTLRT